MKTIISFLRFGVRGTSEVRDGEAKSEIRNPRAEGNPKSESRNGEENEWFESLDSKHRRFAGALQDAVALSRQVVECGGKRVGERHAALQTEVRSSMSGAQSRKNRSPRVRISDLGSHSDFGFRISDFFTIPPAALFILHFALCNLPLSAAPPLTSLDYRVTGTFLQVTPAAVAVPKGIAGSLLVSVMSGSAPAGAELLSGTYVEAVLRGPAFPEPRRLVGTPNSPLMLPVINLPGDYQLDNIRLVDSTTGVTRLEGTPSTVPVRVFDEVLVSRVTSRPLTMEEIQEKGIYIDEKNFRAVEFEVAFVLEGKTIPIQFPVVAPRFTDSTEIIPAAELEARLKDAAVLNQQIASDVVTLPPEFETANLNIQVQGINFQPVDESGTPSLALTIPPIPALLVIPGNIGYLNQFFSVMVFTENASPLGSSLTVTNVQATLVLPPGPDRVPATDYDHPGDDPLRFARIGPNKIVQPVQTIAQPGPDTKLGTADDLYWLAPGESGEAEFLVEGLQEGLHVMDLNLEATLLGLAAGPVKVKGKAAGSVLVRNPRFSMAFSHPRTIRAGEPYKASVTILNTGLTPANLVQVSLNKNALSGAVFEPGQVETIQLGTILPGQTATATYRLRAQRTGAISFSNLTTSDDSTIGRFRLSMGIDERGVILSPDSLAMPDFVNELPAELLAAANRVLGQALSVSTAGQLPTGVVSIAKSTITRRVIELAEAGQRLRYGDPLKRVLPDLLRDWQGGRETSAGFDQILRETEAGQEWREALFATMEKGDALNGSARLVDRASDLAGLGQEFIIASTDSGSLKARLVCPATETCSQNADAERSSLPYSLVYSGANGSWAVTPPGTNLLFTWTFTNAPAGADLVVLLVNTNGQATQLRWKLAPPNPAAVYSYYTGDPARRLQVDLNGDGNPDTTLAPELSLPRELPPVLIAVEQDLTILAGRPVSPCLLPQYGNYGTVLAVMFSKPVTQDSAGNPEAYRLDSGNTANSVKIQPSGRVALINLQQPVSAIRPRAMGVQGVADARGNALAGGGLPVRSVYPGTSNPFTGGVAINGRVLKGNGEPAAGIPVTLTMYDRVAGTFGCEEWVRRVSQVQTDSGGNFSFDFAMSGIPYSISATDTSGLSDEAIRIILESTVKDTIDRQHLEDLANSAATRDTLLGLFAAASLPQAIAKAEGLDRAILNDFVPEGSTREAQTVPVSLRFRGRATVVGLVVAADGKTPIPQAAVNLFPDQDSREQGRGLLSDGTGQFAFFGVPLGIYTIDVTTSDRRARTVAGVLTVPGETTNVVIAVPDLPVAFGTLRGQVLEADNLTPHGNGRVVVGNYNGIAVEEVVRVVTADQNGNWEAADVPIRTYDLVAITFDGKRKGVRAGVTPTPGAPTYANISLEAVTRVFGRVQFEDGRPAPNALVAGGVALVRSDSNGNFELEGVPVGNRNISAGLERNPAAGIDFPRLGSVGANIIAGQDNFVVVKLRSAGKIFGKVVDAQGNPVPGVRVSIPLTGGFYWTDADTNANYAFENLSLGAYTVSAPANATAPQLDEQKLISQIRSGDEDQILAAFEEAARVFVGMDDPLVTGEHAKFRPSTWGYTTTRLDFDGQSVNANIRYIAQGTVAGQVVNHQGVPIGARVRLTGLGPTPSGAPATTIRGERDSDPATGAFEFPNQLLAGPWTVQVASPFYPEVLSQSGFTTEVDPDVKDLLFKFPSIKETNGRIAGRVFNPDGSLVGQGVRVKIDFSADYEIQTGTNGVFDTQIALPANRGYTIDAFDPTSGLRGRSFISMTPGITNFAEVHLLTRDSALVVLVRRANGQPAAGARVELSHGSFPYEQSLTLSADTNGVVRFENLWEGNYAAYATYMETSTRVSARGGATVGPGQTANIELRLEATGSVTGTFVKTDLTTPVEGAQVVIGNLGFASTDAQGHFRFDGMPLGTYRLLTSDPVSGAHAAGSVTLRYVDEVQDVLLVEGERSDVNGYVLESYGAGFVAGATVRISYSDGLTPSRTATTGPDGLFGFPGSPMGGFTLAGSYTMPSGKTVGGRASGELTPATAPANVAIQLDLLGYLPVKVVLSDGITPASRAHLVLSLGGSVLERDTDPAGQALFSDLSLSTSYSLTAISQEGGQLRNGAVVPVSVPVRGTNAMATVILPGVGAVQGTVVGSDGTTPVANAEVILTMQRAPFSGQQETALTDGQGKFAFTDIAVGPYLVRAASVSLAASYNGLIATNGQSDKITIRLGDSGTILGRLVRADGVVPVPNVDVLIIYTSQSVNPGRAFIRTDSGGRFRFENVPTGNVELSVAAPAYNGLVLRNLILSTNGQTLDLGNVPLDEAPPAVVQVNPTNYATLVSTTVTVELQFSEPLDTNTVTKQGIYIRSATNRVDSVLSIAAGTNGPDSVVRIKPVKPLVSQAVYEVVVLSADSPGGPGFGPRDLTERATAAPFISTFLTADNDPPVLLSLFPSNNAVQIDPRAVPRLSFNETVRPTGFVFTVSGPAGAVSGEASLGVDGRVLSFVPARDLAPNARYSLAVSNVFDLAGNRAAGEPFVSTFTTLDTIGPYISLRVASNALPVAGYTVPIEAVLLTNEPGVVVSFSQDLQPLARATNAPFVALAKMPASGSTIVRAIATDTFDNDGPIAELKLTPEPDRPPTITIAGATNPVPSGGSSSIQVTATVQGALSQINASFIGTTFTNRFSTNASPLVAQVSVPATAIPGERFGFWAEAIDALGRTSGEKYFEIVASDGTPPALAILSPDENAPLEKGKPLELVFRTQDNSTNLDVMLVISGDLAITQRLAQALSPNLAGTNKFSVALSNAPAAGGTLVANLTATDAASNSVSVMRTFYLPGEAPVLTYSRVMPPTGPVASGGKAVVNVMATWQGTLSRISATATVAGQTLNFQTNASPLVIEVPVPAFATSDDQVRITAEAVDAAGRSSGPQLLTIPIRDATVPQVAFLSPGEDTLLNPPAPLALMFRAADNSTNLAIDLTVTGAVTFAQSKVLALTPNTDLTNSFLVPLTNTPLDGGELTAVLTASDAGGNRQTITRGFFVAGAPPLLTFTRVTPTNGPLPSSQVFVVDVTASVRGILSNFTAQVTGPVSGLVISSNAATLRVRGQVPELTVPGSKVTITAEVVDGIGRTSGPQSLTLDVSDGTKPSVAFVRPIANSLLDPMRDLEIEVAVSDNGPGFRLDFSLTGKLVLRDTKAVPANPNTLNTFVYTFPATNFPPLGGPVTAWTVAVDSAGNSNAVARTFWLPGPDTTVYWNRRALGQVIACTNNSKTYTWPNNSSWAQASVLGDPCGNGSSLEIQPSNWSTPDYPNATNLDVFLTGLGGPRVELNSSGIQLHSLLIAPPTDFYMPDYSRLTLAAMELRGDGAITSGGCCQTPRITLTDGGVILKSDGEGTFTINPGITLTAPGATIQSSAGTLALPGANSVYTGVSFAAASNATILLVPANQTAWVGGTTTGSGAGTLLHQTGVLGISSGGATFDFPPGLFQWRAGAIAANNVLTNTGSLQLAGDLQKDLRGVWYNVGQFHHRDAGDLAFDPGAYMANLPVGTYFFEGSGGLTRPSCCAAAIFDNYGSVVKFGPGNSSISIVFNNKNGRFDIRGGTLTLANDGVSTGGQFAIGSGAVLDLTGGRSPQWSGVLSGSGAGKLWIVNGTFNASGAVFDMSGDLFQWEAGNIAGTATNVNQLNLVGNLNRSFHGVIENRGLIKQVGAGGLGLMEGSRLINQSEATFSARADTSIYVSTCCAVPAMINFGRFEKVEGTGLYTIGVPFYQYGVMDVQKGSVRAILGGSAENATFAISAGARLNLAGGAAYDIAGNITGIGGGQWVHDNGTLRSSPGVALNLPEGMFDWSGGSISGTVTNISFLTVSGTQPSLVGGTFVNQGTIRQVGTGGFGLRDSTVFWNNPGALFDMAEDAKIYVATCCALPVFNNAGVFRKSNGTGTSQIETVLFNNLGGEIDVRQGRLSLISNGASRDGRLSVGAGAALDLTGGASPTWTGWLTGSGAGRVELNSGTLRGGAGLVLDFPPDLFQWTGGRFQDLVINTNHLTLSGTADRVVVGAFRNLGLVRHVDTGRLGLNDGAVFDNLAGAEYRLEAPASLFVATCCAAPAFNNYGLLTRAGTGESVFAVPFFNHGGQIDVQSGSLVLSDGRSYSSNALITVAAGALLNVTGGNNQSWGGRIVGRGAGTVLFPGGTLTGTPWAELNFEDNLFQWTGGALYGLNTNIGVVELSGSSDHILGGTFVNSNVVRHTGGNLGIRDGSVLRNLPGATYRVETDLSMFVATCCALPVFENYGLLLKAGGTNVTTFTVPFNNMGEVRVDTGRLVLANSGNNVDGRFAVAAGASVDLAGNAEPSWSGRLTGTGAGRIELISGTVRAQGLTLDCAPGLFHWTGGYINGTVTNINEINLSGTNFGRMYGALYNAGMIRHTRTVPFNVADGASIYNLVGGEYSIESPVVVQRDLCCAEAYFHNFGHVRKSGPGDAAITIPFDNQGGAMSVEGGSLTLTKGDFNQSGGLLRFVVGGRNAGQFGQLILSGRANLAGTMQVTLAEGFTPEVGDQFQVLVSGHLSGACTNLDLPKGFTVTYSDSGILLLVTSKAAQMAALQPGPALRITGSGSLLFSPPVPGTYIIWTTTNILDSKWELLDTLSLSNAPLLWQDPKAVPSRQRFYRVAPAE